MSLTILGTYNGSVYGEQDTQTPMVRHQFAFDGFQLANMRRAAVIWGDAMWKPNALSPFVRFDESDVTDLIAALDKPEVDPCHWCEEPGFYDVEGRAACEGHLGAYGLAEDEASA